jgi:nucleoside-diphosphate-sugar epimerase
VDYNQTILIVDDGFLGWNFANYLVAKYNGNRIVLLSNIRDDVDDSVLIVQESKGYDGDIVIDLLGKQLKHHAVRYVSINSENSPDVVINLSRCYGPVQQDSFLSRTIQTALREEFLSVSDNKFMYDWIYLTDCHEALDKIMRFGKCKEEYDVCSGHKMSEFDIARFVLKMLQLPMSLIDVCENQIKLDAERQFDNTKLVTLGWRAKYDIEKGLTNTIDWYKKQL